MNNFEEKLYIDDFNILMERLNPTAYDWSVSLPLVLRYYAKWPPSKEQEYLTLGLAAEVGEVLDHYAKSVRDVKPYDKHKLIKELADVLFFVTMLADREGLALADLANILVNKLDDRFKRGVIQGSGDER